MCNHITTRYRCKRCQVRFFTDTITCQAAWYKRVGRHQCDNTDWTMVEVDTADKLCDKCAKHGAPDKLPIVPKPETAKPALPEPELDSPTFETGGVFGPLSQLDAYNAPYATARLKAFLKRHRDRHGVGVKTEVAGLRDLMIAMSGLDIGVWSSSPSGTDLTGSSLPAELEGDSPLFAYELASSPADCAELEGERSHVRARADCFPGGN